MGCDQVAFAAVCVDGFDWHSCGFEFFSENFGGKKAWFTHGGAGCEGEVFEGVTIKCQADFRVPCGGDCCFEVLRFFYESAFIHKRAVVFERAAVDFKVAGFFVGETKNVENIVVCLESFDRDRKILIIPIFIPSRAVFFALEIAVVIIESASLKAVFFCCFDKLVQARGFEGGVAVAFYL